MMTAETSAGALAPGEANGSAAAVGVGDVRQGIEAAAGDALAEQLDEEHGSEVTDHEVFRSAMSCALESLRVPHVHRPCCLQHSLSTQPVSVLLLEHSRAF